MGGDWVRLTDIPKKRFEVDAGGTGCMLVPIKAFKEVGDPYFTMTALKGTFIPEDWDFCMKAKEKGFKTIVDPSIGTRHWGISNWEYQP